MIRLPRLFSDGMVLQRDTEPRIWGWADPGAIIEIKIGDHFRSAKADERGNWSCVLPRLETGSAYSLTVSSAASSAASSTASSADGANDRIVINNILIGDVWICSGQSNMELPMARIASGSPDEMNGRNELIRQFLVSRSYRYDGPDDDFDDDHWESACPETLPRFYAASYFFAKELYARYGVPIGLINSAAGGSSVEAWMSKETYGGVVPYRQPGDIEKQQKHDLEKIAAWSQELDSRDKGLKEGWHTGSFDGQPVDPTADWAHHPELSRNGAFWFKCDVDIPDGLVPDILLLGCIRDADYAYINGVLVGETGYQYPPRRYPVPPGVLKPGRNTIVVRVLSQRRIGGFVPDKQYSLGGIELIGWELKTGAFMDRPMHEPVMFEKVPTGLWNGMMAPAAPFTVRGVIWYQGESNTSSPDGYSDKFEKLVWSWRKSWDLGDFPFLYVQLANYKIPHTPSEQTGWPELREQQRLSLRIPNTSMVVAIDAGEWNDLHPLNKSEIGRRLALVAMDKAYGEDILSSGPLFDKARLTGGTLSISFANAIGLYIKGQSLSMEIAGEDRAFIEMEAFIDCDTVIVPKVTKGASYVRYLWVDAPDGGLLYNSAGLPASPFEGQIER